MSVWPEIRNGSLKATPQPQGGTSHRKADRIEYEYLLTNGWDTSIRELLGKALTSKTEG
jgi:methionyl-tRNA formyltransferase